MRRQTESASSLCQSNPPSQDRLASKETCALVDTAAEVKAPPVSVIAFLRDRRIEAIPAFHRSVGVRIDVQMSRRQDVSCLLFLISALGAVRSLRKHNYSPTAKFTARTKKVVE